MSWPSASKDRDCGSHLVAAPPACPPWTSPGEQDRQSCTTKTSSVVCKEICQNSQVKANSGSMLAILTIVFPLATIALACLQVQEGLSSGRISLASSMYILSQGTKPLSFVGIPCVSLPVSKSFQAMFPQQHCTPLRCHISTVSCRCSQWTSASRARCCCVAHARPGVLTA